MLNELRRRKEWENRLAMLFRGSYQNVFGAR